MAKRSWHFNAGFLTFFIMTGILMIANFFTFNFARDIAWILIAMMMSVMGGTFPDIDQMWKRVFDHRDWFTHSAFFSLFAMFLVLLGDQDVDSINVILYPILVYFNMGIASHLILDYFPTWAGDKDKELELEDFLYATKWIVDGLSGKEATKKLVGTYLIHFPGWFKKFGFKRQTLDKIWTRAYLFVNAAILIGISFYLVYKFNSIAGGSYV